MKKLSLWSVVLAGALALAAGGPLAAQQTARMEPVGLSDDAQQLTELAEAGAFDRVLASLKAGPAADDGDVAALIRELQDFQDSRAEQSQKQREAYTAAFEKMREQAGAGRLEEAVITAVEAQGLSGDQPAFLREPDVTTLLKQTEAAAKKAEQDGHWVEALNLYRALDLLFDDYSTYHDQLRRASQHVRVLRMYAPTELEKQLRARAERLKKFREEKLKSEKEAEEKKRAEEKAAGKEGEAKPVEDEEIEIRLDKEPWQDRLAGVETRMLKQALGRAAQRHVSSRGYATLLHGAADAMIVLADTPAIADAFPTLKEEAKRVRFRESFVALKGEIDRAAEDLSYVDAASIADRMIDINNRTLALPQEVVVYEMTEGAIDTLDEFSAVIWPYEKESFARNFQGKFYGIGIQISMRDDRIVVVSPLEDTPAMRAGVKAGDTIVKVNGKDTTGWSLDQAVREITGEEGTPVDVTIERVGEAAPLTFRIVRAEIPIESIRGWQHRDGGGWDFFIDPQHKIGYVRLSQFIPQSAEDLDAAVAQMQREGGLNALILDLRFNPGGLLSSAVDVSNRFVSEGIIVSTDGPPDVKKQVYGAQADDNYGPLPVVVLVNQGSASASEIVSGALQDHHRALIVGTRSFGKGSVQDVFPIADNKAYLKLTTQYYKLPGGRIIHRKPEDRTWGVEPDLKVEMTTQQVADAIVMRQKADILRGAEDPVAVDEEIVVASDLLEKNVDPQLEAALLVLKTRLVAQHIALARGAAK